jgi:hypothetical protein
VGAGTIALALVLLAGVLLTAQGWFGQNRLALGAGLQVIVAGVLGGILRVVVFAKR